MYSVTELHFRKKRRRKLMLIAVDIMMRIAVPHHAQCVSRNPVHKNKNKKTMASLPNAQARPRRR